MKNPAVHIVPLFKARPGDDAGSVEHGASSTLLELGPAKFLITAAHSVTNGFIWYPRSKGLGRLSSDLTLTKTGRLGEDRLDIACFRLNAKDEGELHPGYKFCSISEIDTEPKERPDEAYEFTGYPYRKTKISLKSKLVSPKLLAVYGEAVNLKAHEKVKSHPLCHIVIPYPHQNMLGTDGLKIQGPRPEGVSGGPIWKRYPKSAERRLAGIAIEWYDHKLIGTRLSVICEFIRLHHPDLSTFIPPHPHIEFLAKATFEKSS